MYMRLQRYDLCVITMSAVMYLSSESYNRPRDLFVKQMSESKQIMSRRNILRVFKVCYRLIICSATDIAPHTALPNFLFKYIFAVLLVSLHH